MLTFFIVLILLLLALWAINSLLSAFGIGDPIRTVIWVIAVVVAIFFIINAIPGSHTAMVLG